MRVVNEMGLNWDTLLPYIEEVAQDDLRLEHNINNDQKQ